MDIEIEEKKKWSIIRNKLNQNYYYDDNWEEAINLFEYRLMNKFFNPIQQIINNRILKGEGFAILTVQCSLIEMFAAFRNGKIFNHRYKATTSPKYEYKFSEEMFTSLLKTNEIFKNIFWQKNENGIIEKDKPYSSSEFYKNVRCGLMHEAKTKGNWYINATSLEKNSKTEKIFIEIENEKIKIYRTILHYRLLHYLSEYKNELCQNNKKGMKLRKFLARKLDDLFEINDKEQKDWWNEK